MGSLRRTAAAVFSATALVGCALISGAGDLTVVPAAAEDGGGAESAAVDLDASTSDGASSGLDGSRGLPDATDATGADAGEAGTRLREVTFEDGTLVGAHGGDSVFGAGATLATGLNALSGMDSLRVDGAGGGSGGGGGSGVLVGFAAQSELFVTCLVDFAFLDLGSTTFHAFVPEAGGVSAELRVDGTNGPFRLFVGGVAAGSGGVAKVGTTFRVGYHLRHDASTSLVEVFLAGKGAAFGAAIIAVTVPRLGRTVGIRMGVLDAAVDTKAYFDDLLLDTASLPAP